MDDEAKTFLWMVTILIGVIAVSFYTGINCSINECASLCEDNGAEVRWTWTQGCYCKDADGVYNPRDSRAN
jgi:hypothetical protein